MISQSILTKMRLGAAGVGVSIVLSAPHPSFAVECAKPAAAPSSTAPLTDSEIKLLKDMIPKMGDLDYETRQKATRDVFELGQKVTEYLNKELSIQTDTEIRMRLWTIVEALNPKPVVIERAWRDCVGCGRG